MEGEGELRGCFPKPPCRVALVLPATASTVALGDEPRALRANGEGEGEGGRAELLRECDGG